MRVFAAMLLDVDPVARYRPVMNAQPPKSKFQAYRARKKAAGLREIRMWVPDLRLPHWKEEARRQAALADEGADAREASEMMERLTQEAWEDWG